MASVGLVLDPTMTAEFLAHALVRCCTSYRWAGWLKYCLKAFASQAGGKNSVAVKRYDALFARIGTQLSRHSDRDLPRMNFPKGFSSGTNLMGHKITGMSPGEVVCISYHRSQEHIPNQEEVPQGDGKAHKGEQH